MAIELSRGIRAEAIASVERCFRGNEEAVLRSSLWFEGQLARPRTVPTAGEMLASLTQGGVGGKAYDDELPQRQAKTLY